MSIIVNIGACIILGSNRTLFTNKLGDPLNYYLSLLAVEIEFGSDELLEDQKDRETMVMAYWGTALHCAARVLCYTWWG